MKEWGPSIGITLYVDDLTLEAEGTPKEAAEKCAAALDQVIAILENEMGFIISEKKSVIVASNPVVAVATAALTDSKKVTAVRSAKMLGTTTRAGGRRAVSALKVRVEKFRKLKTDLWCFARLE